VIHQQDGDLLKAEELSRYTLYNSVVIVLTYSDLSGPYIQNRFSNLCIRSLKHSSNNDEIGANCDLLARILKSQGKFEDETQGLFERTLATFFGNEGPDGSNTAISNFKYQYR
jgi:hypothetical protein